MALKEDKVFGKRVTRESLYKIYLTCINGILGLTNKEIDIAAMLYTYTHDISKSITDEKLRNELLFSPRYKKEIREELSMRPMLLNNYIASLKKKNIIIEKDGAKCINEKLMIDIDSKNVNVIFKFHVQEL